MKRLLIGVALAIPCVAAGCVPSLNALYTKQDVIFDAGLLGTWKQKNDKSIWTFRREKPSNKKQYHIAIDLAEDNQRKQAEFAGTLVKIKGTTYLDLYPKEPAFAKNTSQFHVYHLLPVHTFAKITREQNSLKIEMMNPTWIAGYLKNHPGELTHVKTRDRYVLTASTAELQSFVDKHKNTEKAFEVVLQLKKD